MALRMILKRFRLLRRLYLFNIWKIPVSLQSNANKLQLNSTLHDKDIVDKRRLPSLFLHQATEEPVVF